VEAESLGKVKVFQAGTDTNNGQLVSSGGRVLGVTAMASSLAEAQRLAYEAVDKIKMEPCHYRTDIGAKGLKR
jgi:phosphoribosylamine--glycine ligase